MVSEGFIFPRGFASKFYVSRGAGQIIPTGAFTVVAYDATVFDILQEYNTTALNAFQPKQAGYYFLEASAIMQALAANDTFGLLFYVNVWNRIAQQYMLTHAAVQDAHLTIAGLWHLTPNDFVQVRVWHDFGANRNTGGNPYRDHFCGFRVG